MNITINLNNVVKVKLTSFGEALLSKYLLKKYKSLGGSLMPEVASHASERALMSLWNDYARDSDGYRSFQLYDLMHIFGGDVTLCSQQKPFINNQFFVYVEQ